MADDRFTPAREREREAEVVAALRQGTLLAPVWLLCPQAPRRSALEAAVARAGGGFFRAVDWSILAAQLDHRLGLPFADVIDETARVLAVERRLEEIAQHRPALREALEADPFGVAGALLGVVDTLRAHGWSSGGEDLPLDDIAESAREVVRGHLALLASAVQALEARLGEGGQLDTLGRMRRATAALANGRRSGIGRVVVEGVDRLSPAERDLLRALAASGCAVDVAPWVLGWGEDDAGPAPTTAAGLREAIDVGAAAVTDPEDASVDAVRARDPFEEAELVARWISERVARGDDPSEFAVSVGAASGAADRVRRALSRWGLASSGGGRVQVRTTALWQVVRASVRLAWRGVDAVDLATVLAAPGSGVWGGDRDRLVAAVRRALPASWRALRDVVREVFSADEPAEDAAEVSPEDAARRERLTETRVRVEALLAIWEQHGPFAKHAAIDRRALLRGAVSETIDRFVRPERFAEAVSDPRDQTVWLLGSQAIDAALRAALERVEERKALLPADDPGAFLAAVESLLGVVEEDRAPPRDEGVAILEEHACARRRPRVLVVTGFVRGRHPAAPAPMLLCGPQERAALRAALGARDALSTDEDERAVAWRQTQRLLALPTERVVLMVPERGADGARAEVSLTWRDLLARMSPARRALWERDGIPSAEVWLARGFEGAPWSARGRSALAISLLGAGDVARAASVAAPLAAEDLALRDLFAARFRPDRAYSLGDLVRPQLAAAVLSPRDLEAAMTCRYRFLATALLGLRPARYARAPSITARDRARVVRDALRRIDARLEAGERARDEGVDEVLDDAIHALVPWAARPEAHAALEELRRTSRSFLLRYFALRGQWGVTRGEDHPDDDRATVFPVTLGEARTIQVRMEAPRVEVRAQGAEEVALAVDFTVRSLDGIPRLRDLGLDLDAALAPLAAEARRPGTTPGAFVRLSLAKPVGDALAARGAETTDDDRVAPFETVTSATAVSVEHHRRIEDHRDVALAQLADVFDAMDRDDAEFAPHDDAEHDRLHDAGARTCEYCDARLACRFRLAGG